MDAVFGHLGFGTSFHEAWLMGTTYQHIIIFIYAVISWTVLFPRMRHLEHVLIQCVLVDTLVFIHGDSALEML